MSIVGILVAILVFFVIVVLHELGHFTVAKLCGIKVNKFAVGMGPVLLKKQKGETEYSLRALPIGGFCAMEGEDDSSDDPRAFMNKPVWQRMLVVLAGPVMNLILGFLLIIITTLLFGSLGNLTIKDFRYDPDTNECISTSAETGLEIGDTILKINGMRILTDTDLSYKLSTNEDDTMQVVVRRNGEKVTLDAVTFRNKLNDTRLDFYVEGIGLTPWNVIRYSFLDTISTGRLIWSSLRDLLSGKYGFHDLSGPVGIVSTIGEAASYGETFKQHLTSVISLASFITVNVGIFNLLPIPALDGARLVFLVVEGIRRKPIPPDKEGMVHFVGMALLFLLMIAVTFQDILRLVQK
ncbi:MAG: site-2 protease family protein [Oscillospiraceae bacterium]|nr:site-2 protease family protein [Oscillospiraceae bacterium]